MGFEILTFFSEIALKLQNDFNKGWSKADKAIMHRVIASVGVPANETAEALVNNQKMFETYLILLEKALNKTEAEENIQKFVLAVEKSGPQMLALSEAGNNFTEELKKDFAHAFVPVIDQFEAMEKEKREEILDKVPALNNVLAGKWILVLITLREKG